MTTTAASDPTPTALPTVLPEETHHIEVHVFIPSERHREHAFGLVPSIPHEGPGCSQFAARSPQRATSPLVRSGFATPKSKGL